MLVLFLQKLRKEEVPIKSSYRKMPADERLKTNLYGEYILELRTEAIWIGCDGFTARYSGMSIARAVLTEAVCVSRL